MGRGIQTFSRTSKLLKEEKTVKNSTQRIKPGKVMNTVQKADVETRSRKYFSEFVTFLMRAEQ